MKVAYIAHPFHGKQKNVDDATRIILYLIKRYPGYTFFSPLHNTGFFYNAVDYECGMQYCFEMLQRSDELWLCKGWANSKGCMMEVAFARQHHIPIFELEDGTWILKAY